MTGADDIPALSRALRATAEKHPELAEPINDIAKNIVRLTKHPDDDRLMRMTSGMARGVLVAMGKMAPCDA